MDAADKIIGFVGGIMRITEIDLQYEDIMWFGVDNQNHIFECTSAGCGNVPEFVCKSKENTDFLEDFFMQELKEFTQEKLLIQYDDTNELLNDCIHLSRKGIYCFDIFKQNKKQYIKLVEPVKPLIFDELPREVKDVLGTNRVDVDVMRKQIISVEHAYNFNY